MSLIGELPKFDNKKDDWQVYTERLEQFFDINDVPIEKRKAILITAISEDVYKMLRDVCYPVLPKNKTYIEIRDYLDKQFLVKLSIGRERYIFYTATQNYNESISSWFARLKKLCVNCKFGGDIETILMDRFISGLQQSPILDKLCEESETLNLQQAIDIAMNKESSLKGTSCDNNFSNSAQQSHVNYNAGTFSTPAPTAVAPVIVTAPRRTYRKRRANPNYADDDVMSKRATYD